MNDFLFLDRPRRARSAALTVLLLLLPSVCWAWSGRVVSVSDGDTLTILHDGKAEKVGLYGIDAPEPNQDFGQKAKALIADLAVGKIADVNPIVTTNDTGTIAIVKVQGLSLNRRLLESGFAWIHEDSCHAIECREWKNSEEHARFRRLGLWAGANPVPPWEFRLRATLPDNPENVPAPGTLLGKKEQATIYHGNSSSKVFHAPGCQHYHGIHATVNFQSKDEAIRAGYKPHGECVR